MPHKDPKKHAACDAMGVHAEMDLISIDPGLHTGYAIFNGGILVGCGLTTPARWFEIVTVVAADRPLIILEMPTIYPHSKARPADVMSLQLKVGELKGRFETIGCRVELVQPRTWKGQVPKAIHGARTLRALDVREQALVRDQRHDVVDAVGLGLWKLGRTK